MAIASAPRIPSLELWGISVTAFDKNLTYSIVGFTNGKFVVNSKKVKISNSTETSCTLEILASKATEFTLSYIAEDGTQINQVIKVQSI